MANGVLPDPELLRQLLRYDPDSGTLFWREREAQYFTTSRVSPEHAMAAWNKGFAGKQAFATPQNCGYLAGRVLRWTLLAHRVAWAIHYGRWPGNSIDHINGDKTDNRICNLRDVPMSLNQRNRKCSNPKSGVDGVRWVEKARRWHVMIMGTYLGRFKTFEEAVAVRKAAERERGYHSNHGRLGNPSRIATELTEASR